MLYTIAHYHKLAEYPCVILMHGSLPKRKWNLCVVVLCGTETSFEERVPTHQRVTQGWHAPAV